MVENYEIVLTREEHEDIKRLCKPNRVTPLRTHDLDSHEQEIEIDEWDNDYQLYHVIIDLEGAGNRLSPYAELLKYDPDMEDWDAIDGDNSVEDDMCGVYYLRDEDEDVQFIVHVVCETELEGEIA